jgi:hypothetical protein
MDSKPPDGCLADAGRRLWAAVTASRELSDAQCELLLLAAKQADRAAEARTVLTSDTMIGVDRFGQAKTHPAVQVERMASLACAKLVEQIVGKVSSDVVDEAIEEDMFD